jgi:hypothetical protein
VQLRAPVALRELLAAPGHGVRRELRAYQLLFDLDDVATRIHSGLCEQRDEFEQACFDLGIHVIED